MIVPVCDVAPVAAAAILTFAPVQPGIAAEFAVLLDEAFPVPSVVAIAGLTLYDMLKSVERGARLTDVRLVEKSGGRSGDVILE